MASNNIVTVTNRTTGKTLTEQARWCRSRLCRLIGLQFRRGLKPGEAIILSKEKDSIASSSIHMFFVFFPIAAIWINGEGVVTSAQLAKPWRPYYASPAPARHVLEGRPELLEMVSVGDRVEFE